MNKLIIILLSLSIFSCSPKKTVFLGPAEFCVTKDNTEHCELREFGFTDREYAFLGNLENQLEANVLTANKEVVLVKMPSNFDKDEFKDYLRSQGYTVNIDGDYIKVDFKKFFAAQKQVIEAIPKAFGGLVKGLMDMAVEMEDAVEEAVQEGYEERRNKEEEQ